MHNIFYHSSYIYIVTSILTPEQHSHWKGKGKEKEGKLELGKFQGEQYFIILSFIESPFSIYNLLAQHCGSASPNALLQPFFRLPPFISKSSTSDIFQFKVSQSRIHHSSPRSRDGKANLTEQG